MRLRIVTPLTVIIEIGEPIEVDPQRDRKAEVDTLMEQIERDSRMVRASARATDKDVRGTEFPGELPSMFPFRPLPKLPADTRTNCLNRSAGDKGRPRREVA